MSVDACPICGDRQLEPLFTISALPVFDNVLCTSKSEANEVAKGMQSITLCQHCGFVFNRNFEPEKVVYGTDYHAERGKSIYFKQHVRDVVQWIHSEISLEQKSILEVACGQGEFLQEFAQYHPRECIGVDPSGNEMESESIVIHQALFNEKFLSDNPPHIDLLVNRHMIEHIQNPLEMLCFFSRALKNGGLLYLETPRLDWILKNCVFYDFPYEHCAYFTDEFMEHLLKAAGFSIIKKHHSYAGQYFSILARKQISESRLESATQTQLKQTKNAFTTIKNVYQNALELFSSGNLEKHLQIRGQPYSGKDGIWLWGASAKGVMCCNLLGGENIAGCIDNNPFKQGKFIPGTGTPVISPERIPAESIKLIFVENDVYYDEIRIEVLEIDPHIEVCSLNRLLGIGSYLD